MSPVLVATRRRAYCGDACRAARSLKALRLKADGDARTPGRFERDCCHRFALAPGEDLVKFRRRIRAAAALTSHAIRFDRGLRQLVGECVSGCGADAAELEP